MSEFHPNRVRPPRPRMTLRRALNFWPALVWLAVVGIAFWAYSKGVKFTRMNGVVDVIQEAVTSDEDGRIEKILVKSGQAVNQGDPIVQLDTAILDEEIKKFEAALKSDLEDRILKYQFDLARLQSQLRDLIREQAGDDGELSGIEATVKELNELQAKVPPTYAAPILQAKAKVEANGARLRAVSTTYPDQVKAATNEITTLEAGLTKLKAALADPESAASANGDLTQLQKLRALKQRATLRSNHTGIVDRIDKDDGEFVKSGEAVVRIVSAPQLIRGFLPQDQLGQVRTGMKIWISSTTDRYTYFPSTILSVSPRISNVPDRSSPLPNRTVHGQEIIAAFPFNSGFQPGQTVVIHLEEPGTIPTITKIFGTGGQPQ